MLALAPDGLAAEATPSVDDDDPDTPGIQISIPFYSEPEFLLVAGDERWDVRNRPVGTAAAAYGHPTGAVHDAFMTSARYDALGGADKQPLDVAFLDGPEYVLLLTIHDAILTAGDCWPRTRRARGQPDQHGPHACMMTTGAEGTGALVFPEGRTAARTDPDRSRSSLVRWYQTASDGVPDGVSGVLGDACRDLPGRHRHRAARVGG